MRWVVLVKPPDDHPAAVRIFGAFRKRANADALCDAIRADIETDEQESIDGYAWVIPLEYPKGRVKDARRYAKEGDAHLT